MRRLEQNSMEPGVGHTKEAADGCGLLATSLRCSIILGTTNFQHGSAELILPVG